jgi:hypothetical protein
MTPSDTSEILRAGLARILDLWRDREGGAGDLLHGVLALQLATARRERPPASSPEVTQAYTAIRGYYDNVRYALLDPTAMIWGTVTNALRVAAGVDSVTALQRSVFSFSADSLAALFRAAHDERSLAEALWRAFRPMPAADCQTLAALLAPQMDARLDGQTVLTLVRVLGNEGPLTLDEAQAMAMLRNIGLIDAAFSGTRGQG